MKTKVQYTGNIWKFFMTLINWNQHVNDAVLKFLMLILTLPVTAWQKWESFFLFKYVFFYICASAYLPKNINHIWNILSVFFIQILSKSVANGLRFYRDYDARLKNCESTAVFCEIFNDLFDALNRTTKETGLRLGCTDFKVYFDL